MLLSLPLLVAIGGAAADETTDVPKREVVHREVPPYTDAARTAKLGDLECVYAIDVGADGVPTAVRAESCHEAFATEGKAALMQWRWTEADAPSTQTLKVHYRLRNEGTVPAGSAATLCKVRFTVTPEGTKEDIDLSDCPEDKMDAAQRFVDGLTDLPPNRFSFDVPALFAR